MNAMQYGPGRFNWGDHAVDVYDADTVFEFDGEVVVEGQEVKMEEEDGWGESNSWWLKTPDTRRSRTETGDSLGSVTSTVSTIGGMVGKRADGDETVASGALRL
ncbi:hypothetical protein HK101_006585 [Irineochytrium annulatum]|nr:hypothetical protein HK101_006585 [Irineochytrium annulatum]